MLTGLSTMSDEQVVLLAKSSLHSPAQEGVQGADDVDYVEAERADHLTAEADESTFTLADSASKPIFNPAVVIRGWDSGAVENVQQDFSRGTRWSSSSAAGSPGVHRHPTPPRPREACR